MTPRALILAELTRAADAGRLCPANADLAARTGLAANTVSQKITALEAAGVIAVERFSGSRVVTIVATGRATTRPAGRCSPHWRVGHAAPSPARVPGDISGRELADTIRAEAARRGVPVNRFLVPLSRYGTSWLAALATAANPTPLTIARVNALFAGQPVPPALKKEGRVGGSAAESLSVDPANVQPSASMPGGSAPDDGAGDAPPTLSRAEALRREVFAENATREKRRALARVLSNAHGDFLDAVAGPAPAPVERSRRAAPAATREPCLLCGTRGDLGCKHRAPAEPRTPLSHTGFSRANYA